MCIIYRKGPNKCDRSSKYSSLFQIYSRLTGSDALFIDNAVLYKFCDVFSDFSVQKMPKASSLKHVVLYRNNLSPREILR